MSVTKTRQMTLDQAKTNPEPEVFVNYESKFET